MRLNTLTGIVKYIMTKRSRAFIGLLYLSLFLQVTIVLATSKNLPITVIGFAFLIFSAYAAVRKFERVFGPLD